MAEGAITFDLNTALAQDIVGQKRTGRAKQFVFIRGEYAIKGPYQQGRLNNVITRSQIFSAWGTPCVVKAIDYFTVPDGTFIRFPNIMAGYQLESELYNETFSQLQYRILKNAPVTDVRYALPTNPWIPNEAEDVILALCHCNILGVGDMNLRNTLVDVQKHQFYIIDFDDNLGADRDDEVFYFNNPPGKKLMWYERVAQHYNKVADRLAPLINDQIVQTNNLQPRVQRAIDLLRRYAVTQIKGLTGEIQITGDVRQAIADLANKTQTDVNINNLTNLIVGKTPAIKQTRTMQKTPRQPAILPVPGDVDTLTTALTTLTITPAKVKTPRQQVILAIPGIEKLEVRTEVPVETPKQLTLQVQGPTLLTPALPRKIGQMVWKGLRGGATKTYSGIDFDVAKSALQKYIRRNMPEKAILAAIELYRLGEIGGDPAVSNAYNRLAIIANEDIGPANLPLVLEVTRIVESGDRDIYRLVAMVQLMAQSPKTRMMSHAWRAYANSEGRAVAMKLGLPLDTGFNPSDLKYIDENKNADLFMPGDPENIRPYVLVFLKRLYEKDFNTFTWAYFFLETAKDITLAKRKKFVQGNPRSTTGKADILLWKALAKILPPQTHDILVEAYYNHTESRPFLQDAILIALYGLPYTKFDIEPAAAIWRQQPVLQEMLEGKYPLEIDDFVVDKHTRKGRAAGMGTQEFVDEGAAVVNQDPNYYSQALEEIYRIR